MDCTVHSAGVLTRTRRDQGVGVPLLTQEAQDRIQRRQPDRAVAQALGVEPVFVEPEPRRQDVSDALVQAGDEDPTDTGFVHVSG